jgi:hypothetical protein
VVGDERTETGSKSKILEALQKNDFRCYFTIILVTLQLAESLVAIS